MFPGAENWSGAVYFTENLAGADVVFLAEGDAAHLVTKEGYDAPSGGAPHFLQGIKEVIELAPSEIERRFRLPAGGLTRSIISCSRHCNGCASTRW